jgi:dipeptidyl aminopeptidase/acylaminoacyl peptidase
MSSATPPCPPSHARSHLSHSPGQMRPAILIWLFLALLPGIHFLSGPVLSLGPVPLHGQVLERFTPEEGYALPPSEVQEFFQRDANFAALDHPDPTGERFLIPLRTELSTLERMGEPTLRLAEMEIRPERDRLWHLDTYGIYGFRIYSLPERTFRDVALPEEAFASDFMWAPDGRQIAFLTHLRSHTQLWMASAETGEAGPVGEGRIMATMATGAGGQGSRPSNMLQWTPEASLLTLVVPPSRDVPPQRPAVPPAPVIRRSLDESAQIRTFPYLLEDEHDAALFEHYTTSQIAEFENGAEPRLIGSPAMYESISLSPDGNYILATVVEPPLSYLTSWRSFPRRVIVLDRQDGTELATLQEQDVRKGRDSEEDDPRRDFRWRPDGSGLHYIQKSEEGSDEHLMLLTAPFDTAGAQTVATSHRTIQNVVYDSAGEHALAQVAEEGREGLVHFDLTRPDPEARVLLELESQDDPTSLRGEVVTQRTGNGLEYALLSEDGGQAYLQGPGFREDFRPQPFIDAVSLEDGSTQRLFQGSTDAWERPLVALDAGVERLIVSRESKEDFPDSFLWERNGSHGSFVENLTQNEDPFPELTAAQRIDYSFTRRDGLEVQARVSLPTDYVEGERVPAIFWTYPREYTSPEGYERAAIRSRNHNAFHHVTWLRWSDIWLSQGYAVVHPDVPIVGENYNDTYIANLSDAMYAAIRATDELQVVDIQRIGHGGHSYGAFATVNLLAHTPYFQAGIAGHGAYNRSLTPAGFQAERRMLWEAPHTYTAMSPFFYAHQIETPLLMYHGADDNNTGTWPMQSERLIHALTNLGKDAVLYMYPFESHTPRALENNLDMWARWLEWFDHYVKGAPSTAVADDADGNEEG